MPGQNANSSRHPYDDTSSLGLLRLCRRVRRQCLLCRAPICDHLRRRFLSFATHVGARRGGGGGARGAHLQEEHSIHRGHEHNGSQNEGIVHLLRARANHGAPSVAAARRHSRARDSPRARARACNVVNTRAAEPAKFIAMVMNARFPVWPTCTPRRLYQDTKERQGRGCAVNIAHRSWP